MDASRSRAKNPGDSVNARCRGSGRELFMRKRVSLVLLAAVVSLLVCVNSARAQAQASRTWVSGVGDDVNPCSRTAPCTPFAGAIAKTAVMGEINCLDPGG